MDTFPQTPWRKSWRNWTPSLPMKIWTTSLKKWTRMARALWTLMSSWKWWLAKFTYLYQKYSNQKHQLWWHQFLLCTQLNITLLLDTPNFTDMYWSLCNKNVSIFQLKKCLARGNHWLVLLCNDNLVFSSLLWFFFSVNKKAPYSFLVSVVVLVQPSATSKRRRFSFSYKRAFSLSSHAHRSSTWKVSVSAITFLVRWF